MAKGKYLDVFTSAIRNPTDFAIAISTFMMLVCFRLAPWLVAW